VESVPTETLLAVIAIVVPFVVFAVVIASVDYYSNHRPQS
jgi:hypothetical protein